MIALISIIYAGYGNVTQSKLERAKTAKSPLAPATPNASHVSSEGDIQE
jgi:hypothetical protein